MNSYMNITVRVASAQALAQLRAIQTQAAATGNAGNIAGGALAGMVGARAQSSMVKFGNQLQWTGRQLQYNFTLPIVLAGAAATKFALDNERAFVKVVKVYGDVGMSQKQITSETNALRGAFVALSNHFGVQQKEVLDVAASWAAAGASGLALAKDVKLTMETMILGEMGAADATNALIAIQAQYNQNTDQLTKTIQILNMVENQTGISLEGLVQGMSRAAGTAAGAGIDVRHLAAMLAAMTPAAGSAAQAGNALKTIISRLFAPTSDAAAVMKTMGINVASTAWQSKNGSQRMETLADSFSKLNKAQQSAASSIIASRFQINKFGVLMKDIANRNTDAGKSISYYARALESTSNPQAVFNQMQRELNQVLTSNPQRLKQIWTILQNAMADVVTPMIPALLMLAQMLQRAVTWFSQLNPSIQKFVGVGLLMLALFGPLIRYAGSLITLVMELGNTFKILALPLTMVGGLLGSVGGILGGAFTGALTAIRVVLLGAGAAVGLFGGAFVRLLSPITSVIGTIAGPLMRGFGTIVSGTFIWLGATMASLWSAAWGAITALTSAGVGAVSAVFGVLPMVLRQSASILWTGLAVIWEAGTAAIGGVTSIFVRSTFFMMSTLFTGLPAMFSRGFAILVGTTRFGLFGILGLITSLPGLVLRSGPALIGALGTLGRLAVLAFTSPWGAAIALVVGAIVLFRNQISQIIQNIIGLFYQLPDGLIGALRSVVQVVQAAAMQVYEWMQYLNPFARHSPSVVDNVTAGMAAINAQVATLAATSGPLQKAGADMQRYGKIVASMKNAQSSRQRADDRASVGKVSPQALSAFDTLNRDLGSLNGLLATSQAAINAQQRVVDSWSAALDRANTALDAEKAKLDSLQKVQQAANDQLSAAKDRLSQWASTPIQGMKAMSDAIFNNSMQQKRLQLQMMKMEDSIGPIDKVRSRIDKLNGEMELARGTATALREKGAGSDILKVYDQQIGKLATQKKAITQQLKPYDDLQAALDKLQRKGQELDLENSLKFDPLTRQIEQAANAMKEMPFDVIMKGVQQARADITRYQAAVDQATAAVNAQQKAVDAAQKARDAISARYDAENKKLEQLKKSYQGVQDAIDGVKNSLGDMSGAANDAIQRQQKALDDAAAKRKAHEAALKKARAAAHKKGPKVKGLSPQMQAFMDAGKAGDFPGVTGTGGLGRQGTAGDQSKMIDQFTKDLAKQTAGMFDGFDIFGPIKDKWNQFVAWLSPKVAAVRDFLAQIFKGVDWSQPFRGLNFEWLGKLRDMVISIGSTIIDWVHKIWQLIGPDIINIGKQIWAGLQSIWQQIQPQLAQFGELWTPAKQALSNIWAIMKPVLQAIGLGFLGAASILLHVLGSIIGPVFEAIGGILAGFLSIVRGVLRIVIGLFTGDWSMLWKGVVDIFSGAWRIITSLFVGVGKTLWGLVSGLVTGIVNFFKWLYNMLVGHSIIPDIVKGILTWFYKLITLPGWILSQVLKVIYNFISGWWSNTLLPKIIGIYNGITQWFHNLNQIPGWLLANVWNPIWSRLSGWWAGTMAPKVTAIRNGIEAIFHGLGAIPGWLYTNAWKPASDRLSDVWNKYMKPLGNAMIRGFANIFNTVGQAIANGINIGIGAVNKLIDGLNWIGGHVPGLNFHIGGLNGYSYSPWKPPQFATGGGLPASKVGAGFKTNGIRAIVGEGNPNHPEFVIPTDPRYRSRTRMLIAQAAKEAGIGFDLGGILSGIGSVAGKVKDTILNTGSTLLRKAVDAAFSPIYNAAMSMTNSIDNRMHLQDMVRAPFTWAKQWSQGIENAVPKEITGGPVPGGSGVKRWAPMMLKALAASGLPGSLLPNELTQIATESGGNPNAVQGNIGDINNRTGDLAKGLLQVIGATFRAYHVPGTSYNVFDPWANMMASLNYQKHRYGPDPASIAAVIGHGHGYARGGILSLFDNGGVLRPGLTLAYNGTGKNERVLTARQENQLSGPREVHFHGDLSFPNVRDGNDAEDFIKNLEILAGGR